MPRTIIAALMILAFALAAPAAAKKKKKRKKPAEMDPAAEQAKAAFDEGVGHFEAARYDEANTAFRRANEIKPSWKLLYNIGQCEAALKRYDLALEAFEDYVAEGGDDVPTDRQQEVLAEVGRLRQMVGFLEVSGQAGDVIFIDGVERGTLPDGARLRVSMGEIQVRVERDGAIATERRVEIFGGGTTPIEVDEPLPEPEPGPEPRPEPVEEDGGGRVWTWVAFGVGGAAGIGAGVTGGLALAKRKDIDSQCTDDLCPQRLKKEEDKVGQLSMTTNVLIGVAAVGVAAGVVLAIFEPDWFGDSEVTVAPTAGEDAAGLIVTGRF